MGNLKSIVGVIGALFSVLYFAGLFYYFVDVAGSVENAKVLGLGPTLVEVAAFGLLFLILLILRIWWMVARPPSPGSGRRDGPDVSTPDDEGGFDADATIARYMASRSIDSPAAPAARGGGGGPPSSPSFGRRNT
jgi:hypothetical protein